MIKALIAYLTYSGNTEEVAQMIAEAVRSHGIEPNLHEIGLDKPADVSQYDYIFLGTFTWDYGATPDEVKDFVLEVGYKLDCVAVFGTGDTQFGGDELYCRAVDKLAHFYNSRWPGLKIEQSPRGVQEANVTKWTKGVLQDAIVFA